MLLIFVQGSVELLDESFEYVCWELKMSNEHLSLDGMDFLAVQGQNLDYPDEHIPVLYLPGLSLPRMKRKRKNFLMNKYFDVVDRHNVEVFEMVVGLMEILLEDKQHA